MVTLVILFILFEIMFAIIGVVRGWAKEVLVSAAVILGISLIVFLEKLFPPTAELLKQYNGTETQFWIRTGILGLLILFGYQSPRIPQIANATEKKGKFSFMIVSLLAGLFSGYLIVGTLWFYMHQAGYPFKPFISSPETDQITGDLANSLLKIFAPQILTGYSVLLAVILIFAFIMVVIV